jgi:single-strand DNA-binding protein
MVIGHLGQGPEIRCTPAGMPIVNLSVATDETYLDKDGKHHERTEWHRIVVVSKMALTCHEYLKKGQQVFVEGRLRNREFEAKTDGHKHYRTEITATQVQFLGASAEEKADNANASDALGPADSAIPF